MKRLLALLLPLTLLAPACGDDGNDLLLRDVDTEMREALDAARLAANPDDPLERPRQTGPSGCGRTLLLDGGPADTTLYADITPHAGVTDDELLDRVRRHWKQRGDDIIRDNEDDHLRTVAIQGEGFRLFAQSHKRRNAFFLTAETDCLDSEGADLGYDEIEDDIEGTRYFTEDE